MNKLFRQAPSRLLRPGFRQGAATLPGGQIEPLPALFPAISDSTASSRQFKLARGKLPSDSITLDAAAAAGSKLILVLEANGPLTFNAPTGFTAVSGFAHTTGTGISHAAFQKNAAGGETTVAWTAASGTATAVSAILVEVQDVHANAVVAGQSVVNAGTVARASGSASGTTPAEGSLVLAFWGCQAGASVDATTARGFSNGFTTQIFSASTSTAPGIAMGSKSVAAGGELVSTEWTWTGDAADENLLGLIIIRSETGALPVWTPSNLLLGSEVLDYGSGDDSARMFLDSAGTSPITNVDLEKVARWNGVRGVLSWIQPAEASRPERRTDTNPNLSNGFGQGLYTSAAVDLSGSDAITIIIAASETGGGADAYQMMMESSAAADANNGAFFMIQPFGASNFAAFRARGTVFQDANISSGAQARGGISVITGQADISADLVRIYRNGVLRTTTAADLGTGNFGSHVIQLGYRAGGTLYFFGRFYAWLIIGRLLSDSERAQAETWLGAKAGLTL